MQLSAEALAQIAKIAQENHSTFEKVVVKVGRVLQKCGPGNGWGLICNSNDKVNFPLYELVFNLYESDSEGCVTVQSGRCYKIVWADEAVTRDGWLKEIKWQTDKGAIWPNRHGDLWFSPNGEDGYQVRKDEVPAFLQSLTLEDRKLIQSMIDGTASS